MTITDALQHAITCHKMGQFADAEKFYRMILQVQPKHPDANHNLGVLAVNVGQIDAALPFLKIALEMNPQVEQFWVSYADALLRMNRIENVSQIIQLAHQHGHFGQSLQELETQVLSLDHPLTSAVSAREIGDYKTAIDWLNQYLVKYPANSEALALLGHVLLLDKQDSRAETVLIQAQSLAPSSSAVQRNLARLALKKNQPIIALKAAQNALNADSENPENWLIQAATLSANKRDAEALVLVERVLQVRPSYAEAWASHALIHLRAKNYAKALADIEQALALKPHMEQFWQIAANLYYQTKNLPNAIRAMQKALEIDSGNVDYMVSLGEFLRQNYQTEAAITILDKAITISPNCAKAWVNMGTVLHGAGHLEKARIAYENALRLEPDQAEVMHNLGALAKNAESCESALKYFDQALTLNPNNVNFLASKGQTLLALRRPLEDIQAIIQKIFAIQPNHESGLMLLGMLYVKLGRLTDAENCFRQILSITPNSVQANIFLGEVLRDSDELIQAEVYFQRALEFDANNLNIKSALLFTYNYLAHHSPTYRLEQAKHYGSIASSKVSQHFVCHDQLKATPHCLRVGLVSGDFRQHVVSYFLESFLPHIDKSKIELIGYPTQPKSDDMTKRLQSYFVNWVPLCGMSDEAAAKQIINDNIHILFDLSGHTSYNRLSLFAWKPAPIQASWLGYFATTGIKQIDYLLGDPYVTPPDEEQHFIEKIWRMPETYLCFSPPTIDIEVKPLPSLTTGFITFGCFNNLAKMNDAVVALWACVLLAVPNSRLLLKTKQLADEKQRTHTINRFLKYGISADRLILDKPALRAELLATYHKIDIALDPFPYPGGTTSAEALWMGVPVLTKKGDCFLSHVGESIIQNVGLADWIAENDADYIAKAVFFSSNITNLSQLRMSLRPKVLTSPLCDAPRFARQFEKALWKMWQNQLDK